MSRRRVVVTGLGMVTPLGLNVEDTWKNILAGKSGVRSVEHFDVSNLPVKFSASVQHFDSSEYLLPKEARKVDMFIQFGIAAAHQAMKDSGLDMDVEDPTRIGVAIGSGIGGLPTIERNHMLLLESGARKLSPFFIPSAIINMAAGYVSIKNNLQGPNISIVTACTTGAHNIGHAARMIAYGDADVMVAGGAEMATIPLGIGGFAAARALSTRNDEPQKASRPWDKDRDGFVLGDGAGVVILEEYERAKARGARIYAELSGMGMSADAFHVTMPGNNGAQMAMKNALTDARMNPEEVDYINAHGTSTPVGDRNEAMAIQDIFGEHASSKKLAVSSTKSMIGHLLGAAGAVEAIFSILAIRDQVVPPTINLDNRDEEIPDLNFVPHTAQEMPINATLSSSFGFGGTNGTLLFKQI